MLNSRSGVRIDTESFSIQVLGTESTRSPLRYITHCRLPFLNMRSLYLPSSEMTGALASCIGHLGINGLPAAGLPVMSCGPSVV